MKVREFLDKLKRVPKNVALYLEFPDGSNVPFSKTDIEIRNYEEVLSRGTMSYDSNVCIYRPTRYEIKDVVFSDELKVNLIKLIE